MRTKQRGRPPMSRGTKQRKKDFDYKLKCYSTQALDNVIHLPEDAVIYMLMEEIKEHRNMS